MIIVHHHLEPLMRLATLPALFISHGAPTLALDAGQVGAALRRLSSNLPKPRAIVVMSAHWESHTLEVSTGTRPETWHDFRGFAAPLYQLRYPAAGDPALAERILQMLHDAGITAHGNAIRPRDHGVWIPLLHLYPDADIPVVQLSIPLSFDAAQLQQVGRVLAPLRESQILLIGSGSITHNLRELSWQQPHSSTPEWASGFRHWIVHHLAHNDDAILDWQTHAPYARRNHPTDEHLNPLFFAMGAGSRFSLVHSSFMFGALGMDIYRFD
jgi:4,5-DOPA dioxygenase extradiol